jgi:hypothetical protein
MLKTMKNKYPGQCYICGQPVGPGDGQFEPHGTRGRVRHENCKQKGPVGTNAST